MLEPTSTNATTPLTDADLAPTVETIKALQEALRSVIRGRDDTIDLVLTALIADGHVLLEDYPGSGKTTLTKTLGQLISGDSDESEAEAQQIHNFRRIQFTPDMLPGDVLGVTIFEPSTGNFSFKPGPVFAHIVLADELNRTGPKVQAAFLECMAEKQVTIDNQTYKLDDLFFVVGTQNPLDLAGTYPLPLVQLDRFLLKIPMSYVDRASELDILLNHDQLMSTLASQPPVASRADILNARAICSRIAIHPLIRETLVDIVQATRNSSLLQFGASTRAALMLQKSLRAFALVQGRSFVTEDDVKQLTPYVLGHRLRFHGGPESQRQLLDELLLPHIDKLIRANL